MHGLCSRIWKNSGRVPVRMPVRGHFHSNARNFAKFYDESGVRSRARIWHAERMKSIKG